MLAKHTYTTMDLCQLFGITAPTANGIIDRGIIPGFRVPGSGHRRVHHRDLIKFLKSREEYRPLIGHIEVEVRGGKRATVGTKS